MALGDVDAGMLRYMKPRVYEVGRNGAFDLGSLSPEPAAAGEKDLYPTWQYHKPVMTWVFRLALSAIITGLILIALFGWRIKQAISDEWFDDEKFRLKGVHRFALSGVMVVFLF